MDTEAGPRRLNGEWRTITGLPEYEWDVELEFLTFVRDQVKFESLDGLLAQMARDCERCLEIARRQHTGERATEPAGSGMGV